ITLPPLAASCDYAFCKGANAALHRDWRRVPASVRGVFGIRAPGEARAGVRLAEITDGTSTTLAMGDAAGGAHPHPAPRPTPPLPPALTRPAVPAPPPPPARTSPLDQCGGAAGAGHTPPPWSGSVPAVTPQYALPPAPRDEPMNRRPATPSVYGGDPRGDN